MTILYDMNWMNSIWILISQPELLRESEVYKRLRQQLYIIWNHKDTWGKTVPTLSGGVASFQENKYQPLNGIYLAMTYGLEPEKHKIFLDNAVERLLLFLKDFIPNYENSHIREQFDLLLHIIEEAEKEYSLWNITRPSEVGDIFLPVRSEVEMVIGTWLAWGSFNRHMHEMSWPISHDAAAATWVPALVGKVEE